MKTGGRLAAAIEVLKDIIDHHRPANEALKDWGRSHRFAGSGDRAAIGNLVYDGLRQRLSLSWKMQDESPRALVLGVFVHLWQESVSKLEQILATDEHSPGILSKDELSRFASSSLENAPMNVQADVPEWLWSDYKNLFASEELAVLNGQAMAQRAPIDIRVNSLKSNPDKILKLLSRLSLTQSSVVETALRIPAPAKDNRSPNIVNDKAYQKGWIELQDEGSQIAAELCGTKAGEQVLDFCAGGGGKTLALSALLQNKGQIHAYDNDKSRLSGIYERLNRAGTRNVQVIQPGEGLLDKLIGKMDLVLVDAPCSGSGTWRRKPDAKWRISEKSLSSRVEEQRNVLSGAAQYVKPGGRLVYVTCSMLQSENLEQAEWFRSTHSEFQSQAISLATLQSESKNDISFVQLTPYTHKTDGFFIASFKKS